MIQDLPFFLATLHDAYAGGLRPAEVMRECRRRIEAAGDPGIFLHLPQEADLVAMAEALGPFDPQAMPLYGLPFAVKDNIDVAGWPTTAGCPAFAYTPDADAFVIAQLRAAGAIPVGKASLDQFATGLNGTRTTGPAPLNAINAELVPGGSSGGSGVAVGRGLVSFSLGTDTAGSGRVPAAMNGIVGLKPTLGAFSASGVVPACRSCETVSVFALSVDDAHAVFRAATAYDPADGYARPVAAPLPGPVTPLAIGVPDAASREFFGDAAQEANFAATLDWLKAQGHRIAELDFAPLYEIAVMLYDGPWVAERHAVIQDLMERRPDAVLPVIREIVGKAGRFSATDTFRAQYRFRDLKRQAEALMAGLDMLCVPTVPALCSLADIAAEPVAANSRLGTYTNFVNLLDMAALAVPVMPRADGHPGNVTLIAGAGEDAVLASLGRVMQADLAGAPGAPGWPLPALAPAATAAAADEIIVAAVGAHMSGLPLNHELTSRGGRFLEAARTAPDYRFYALAGGPPKRPGLVRCGENEQGHSIAVELWALPASQMGDFMKGIPAPLTIGTLTISDGRGVLGFLCESAATATATEISHLGGWRAFLETLTAKAAS
ncbi:allophanate hydrolase [Mangrovicoccus algicola]|uniref:Allophanate hydrolase n=1 Tax=Mangrovicoccus algicola TaxID=2771008 RepID=A0A8J6Z1V7_9RHOB|nr:allophanate hydrolase [Mangrovicoccus algicola]MBE3640071.1 allophanate hydrolase [Mangrovicoccus algicola]